MMFSFTYTDTKLKTLFFFFSSLSGNKIQVTQVKDQHHKTKLWLLLTAIIQSIILRTVNWKITYGKRSCNLLFISRRCAPHSLLLRSLKHLVIGCFYHKVSAMMRGSGASVTFTPLQRRRLRTFTRRACGTTRQTVITRRTGTDWRRLRTAVIIGPMHCSQTFSHNIQNLTFMPLNFRAKIDPKSTPMGQKRRKVLLNNAT